MSRENKSDVSMNSAYLDAFRRRKNKLLADEINFAEGESASDRHLSGNSVYLETFRRRKNKQLADELNIDETVSDRSDENSSDFTGFMNRKSQSSELAFDGHANGKKNDLELPLSIVTSEGNAPEHPTNLQNNRLQSFSEDGVHDHYPAENDMESPDKAYVETNAADVVPTAKESSDHTNGYASKPNMSEKRGTPTAKSHVDPVKPLSKTDSKPINETKDQKGTKKKHTKITVFLCVVVIVCGFVVFTRLMSDSVMEEDESTSLSSQNKTESIISERTESTERTTSEPIITSATSTTSTTSESTTEAETTTTSGSAQYETLSPGQEGDEVLKMQKRLARLGYISEKSCTGIYGDNTERMVKLFQAKAGLKRTGIADSETLEKLYARNAPDCFD